MSLITIIIIVFFFLNLEPFRTGIRASKMIVEIQTRHRTLKNGLYVDDVLCYLRSPFASVKALDSLITEFRIISGCKVNFDKSILSGFHIKEEMGKQILKIMPGTWQKEGIKYLVIRVCRSKEAMLKQNIMPIITHMRGKC